MKIQDSVTKAPTPIPAPAEKLPFSSRPFAEPAAPEVTAAQPNAPHYSLRTISLAVQPKLTIGSSEIFRKGDRRGMVIQRTPDDTWNRENFDIGLLEAEKILRSDFYANWFLAKQYLLDGNGWQGHTPEEINQKKPAFKKLMQVFLDLRTANTELLLEYIRDVELPKEQEFSQLPKDERLAWGAAGSQTLTSDIDVNLKGKGSIAAVSLFNKLFKTKLRWPYDPGTVFDVNVYAQDFMTPGANNAPFTLDVQEVGNGNNKKQIGSITPVQETDLGQGNAFQEFSADQDLWSLVKMRIYMTPPEWQNYKTSMIPQVDVAPNQANRPPSPQQQNALAQQKKLTEKFDEAEAYYLEYHLLLQDEIGYINTSQEQIHRDLRQNLELSRAYLSRHQVADTKKMMAANQIYEKLLDEVAAIRLAMGEMKQEPLRYQAEIQELGTRIKRILSHAMIYANEAYFTQGAVHFSVIGQQIAPGLGKKKNLNEMHLIMSHEEHLHSFREQVGDTLKTLEHCHDMALYKAVYKAGKYIDRMIKSAAPLIQGQEIANFDNLAIAGATALELKGGDDTTDEQIQQKMLDVTQPLGEDVGAVRSLLIQFAGGVEKAYQQGQARVQPLPDNQPQVQQPQVQQPIAQVLPPPAANNPVGAQMQQNVGNAQGILDILLNSLAGIFRF